MNQNRFQDDEDDFEDFAFEEDSGPSKSQLKRESADLRDLAKELTELEQNQLESLDLPDTLLEAIRVARIITAHGAVKRQMKYIGKLLRNIDHAHIRVVLERSGSDSMESVRLQHECERWRTLMLEQGLKGVDVFVQSFPGADRQKLRQLIKDCTRESDLGLPPRSSRILFRTLRELISLSGEAELTESESL